MSQVKALEQLLVIFRAERDWKKFRNLKGLAIAFFIELVKLTEVFLWKSGGKIKIEEAKEKLATVLTSSIFLGFPCNLNLEQIFREKMQNNEEKYFANKATGVSIKYSEL